MHQFHNSICSIAMASSQLIVMRYIYIYIYILVYGQNYAMQFHTIRDLEFIEYNRNIVIHAPNITKNILMYT